MIKYKRTHTSMWKEICFVNKETNKNIVPGALSHSRPRAAGGQAPRGQDKPLFGHCAHTAHDRGRERSAHTVHFPREARVENSLTQRPPGSPSYLKVPGECIKSTHQGTHSDTRTTIAGVAGARTAEPSKRSPREAPLAPPTGHRAQAEVLGGVVFPRCKQETRAELDTPPPQCKWGPKAHPGFFSVMNTVLKLLMGSPRVPATKAHEQTLGIVGFGRCDVFLELTYLYGLTLCVTLAGLRDAR